jgi:hypothetical protein
MIAVAVTYYDRVEMFKRNPQFSGILEQYLSLPRVKQHPQAISFHQEGSAVLAQQPQLINGILG